MTDRRPDLDTVDLLYRVLKTDQTSSLHDPDDPATWWAGRQLLLPEEVERARRATAADRQAAEALLAAERQLQGL